MNDATTSTERVRSALSRLDFTDRDVWVKAAMCIKHEFGDAGYDIWDEWGAQHGRYQASAAKAVWRSVGDAGKVTIGSLFFDAKAAGWKDTTKYKPPSREEIERRNAAAAARAEAAEREEAIARAAAAEHAQALWDRSTEVVGQDHPYLARKGIASHGLRVGTWDVVNPDTGEVRTLSKRALLVPIRDAKKRIHSMQAIFPGKIGDRDKDYLRDGAKAGMFYSIGKPVVASVGGQQRAVIVIGEGYATMSSIHEVTGHACIVAFDAGNVVRVAKIMREKFPEACLLFAADNDQWNTDAKGNPTNPGVTKASEAAALVDGLVVVPAFGRNDERRPKDFNDLHQLCGEEAVFIAIADALNPPPEAEGAAPAEETAPWEGEPEAAAAPAAPAVVDDDDDGLPEHNGHFTILGYNRRTYYIFQHGKRQIAEVGKGEFGMSGLIDLAPLNWWEMTFPGNKGAIDTNAATEFIIRTAEKRGIFDTEKVRGRGAWMDDGRVVYHHGSHLSVDGQPVDVTRIPSKYVYELAQSMQAPGDAMLTDAEGQRIIDIIKMFRWSVDGSAMLFAGWLALAPICGAIPWRPHVWMTGGAGSGKSSLAKFGHSLLKGTDVFAQGNSTEAGIRQRLRADARPVIMDESESNEEGDARRVQSILGLIRQASTESDAETLKGTTDGGGMTYHIRSMFCLASIQVALKHKADIDRLTVLSLKSGKAEDTSAGGDWEKMKEAMYQISGREDSTVRARLLRRSIDLLKVTLQNIDVFSSVGAQVFGSQRDGDQYGALLAGAWSLVSTEVASREQARAMFDAHNWQELRDNADGDESQRALAALMGAHVRVKGGIELTVYELVMAASGNKTDIADLNDLTADAILHRYGMKVKSGYLVLANNSDELKKLMQGTTFEADWRGVLLRVEGADKNNNRSERFSGVQTKCIRIPLEPLVGAVAVPVQEAF